MPLTFYASETLRRLTLAASFLAPSMRHPPSRIAARHVDLRQSPCVREVSSLRLHPDRDVFDGPHLVGHDLKGLLAATGEAVGRLAGACQADLLLMGTGWVVLSSCKGATPSLTSLLQT